MKSINLEIDMNDYQKHLLVLFMEECCELAQATSKCLRFSPEHCQGVTMESNGDSAYDEALDLVSIAILLKESGMDLYPMFSNPVVDEVGLEYIEAKKERVKRYWRISLDLNP